MSNGILHHYLSRNNMPCITANDSLKLQKKWQEYSEAELVGYGLFVLLHYEDKTKKYKNSISHINSTKSNLNREKFIDWNRRPTSLEDPSTTPLSYLLPLFPIIPAPHVFRESLPGDWARNLTGKCARQAHLGSPRTWRRLSARPPPWLMQLSRHSVPYFSFPTQSEYSATRNRVYLASGHSNEKSK